MNAACIAPNNISESARERFLDSEPFPFLAADWMRALFIHYEVDADILQPQIPFELDLCDGKARVSLVAFSQLRFRPRFGGRLAEWLFQPLSNHEFLNVRAYVRHRGERGIYFIAEWLNSPLCVWLGPHTYGLPYRFGNIACSHCHEKGNFSGIVRDGHGTGPSLRYSAQCEINTPFAPCVPGTSDEFLLERYTAFTWRNGTARRFRIWHKPWPQIPVQAQVHDNGLLCQTGHWSSTARLLGANYSPGVEDIWIGAPKNFTKEIVASPWPMVHC